MTHCGFRRRRARPGSGPDDRLHGNGGRRCHSDAGGVANSDRRVVLLRQRVRSDHVHMRPRVWPPVFQRFCQTHFRQRRRRL